MQERTSKDRDIIGVFVGSCDGLVCLVLEYDDGIDYDDDNDFGGNSDDNYADGYVDLSLILWNRTSSREHRVLPKLGIQPSRVDFFYGLATIA